MDQHGPEVAPSETPGLEVVPDNHYYHTQGYGAPPYKADEPAAVPPPVQGPRRRLRWWIIGGVVLVVVIVGAVVGGVVGSRASRGGSSNTPSPSATSTPTSTPLKSIRPNSHLAVTGYRGNGDFKVQLFYQGPDNVLRQSSYNSARDSWSDPLELDSLAPMAKTPIAASTWLTPKPPRVNLYYVDESSILRGQKFRDGVTPAQGQSGDINSYAFKMDGSSRLSAFHPHMVAQDPNGKIRWLHWSSSGDWDNRTFNGVVGSPGSGLSTTSAAVKYYLSGAFMYRNKAGKLTAFVGSTNGTLNSDWAWSGAELSTPIPADTAIGTFVYARQDDLVNTYNLYQDTDGVLQVVWQNDSSGWQGPETYPALSGADKGTDIVCVTQAAWDDANVAISSATDMNRCYFQSEYKVKEVLFDGKDWKDLGFLPIT